MHSSYLTSREKVNGDSVVNLIVETYLENASGETVTLLLNPQVSFKEMVVLYEVLVEKSDEGVVFKPSLAKFHPVILKPGECASFEDFSICLEDGQFDFSKSLIARYCVDDFFASMFAVWSEALEVSVRPDVVVKDKSGLFVDQYQRFFSVDNQGKKIVHAKKGKAEGSVREKGKAEGSVREK